VSSQSVKYQTDSGIGLLLMECCVLVLVPARNYNRGYQKPISTMTKKLIFHGWNVL